MIQINASTRLKLMAAKADVSQAKNFIEKHLKVNVDELDYSSNGLITFWCAKGQDVDAVIDAINKATKIKPKKLPRHGSPDDTYQWNLDQNRYVQLSTGFSWKLKQVVPSTITLGDSA